MSAATKGRLHSWPEIEIALAIATSPPWEINIIRSWFRGDRIEAPNRRAAGVAAEALGAAGIHIRIDTKSPSGRHTLQKETAPRWFCCAEYAATTPTCGNCGRARPAGLFNSTQAPRP